MGPLKTHLGTKVGCYEIVAKWYAAEKRLTDDLATHTSKLEDLLYCLILADETMNEEMTIKKILLTLSLSYGIFISV